MGSEYRNEYKYLLDACDTAVLKSRVRALLPVDPHAGSDGRYVIKSVYMDDPEDSCFYDNLNGADHRDKYRIRCYNNDSSYIVLEKKSKLHGMTKKLSCVIDWDICSQLINGRIPEVTSDMDKDLAMMLTEIRTGSFVPKVVVAYERTAFVYGPGNVRITFDEDLASSSDIFSFPEAAAPERPVWPAGMSLLEVKWDAFLPSFIRDVVNIDSLSWSAFSKYCQSRVISCYGGVRT